MNCRKGRIVRIEGFNNDLFHEKRKQFKFQSFLPRTEIIDALVKVRADCNRLAHVKLFNTKITKSVKLEEFEQIQTQAFIQEIAYIKERYSRHSCHSLTDSTVYYYH